MAHDLQTYDSRGRGAFRIGSLLVGSRGFCPAATEAKAGKAKTAPFSESDDGSILEKRYRASRFGVCKCR